MEYELQLASRAPHDVVFLDGSLATPMNYFNQAMAEIANAPEGLKNIFLNLLEPALVSYKEILTAPRSDKVFVGVPKYSSRKEVRKRTGLKESYGDRALLTFVLSAGEFFGPVKLEEPESPWTIKLSEELQSLKKLEKEIRSALDNLYILYYRPQPWLPAMRLEFPSSIANNNQRLAVLLKGVEYQCASASIMEPYPLYISDRMVKHLSRALPAIRQSVTQHIATKYSEDTGDIYLGMHSYRTEGGR